MATTKKAFKEVILHWTASGYNPNQVDCKAYHYLIDGQGKLHYGYFKPEDNLDCNDGKYAQHCGGGNTGRIGIAFCGMNGYSPSHPYTCYPINITQVEAVCKLTAEILIKYNLPSNKVRTHAEFGIDNPNTSSHGKIDIHTLCYNNIKGYKEVGDLLRKKINWYYTKLKDKEIPYEYINRW